MNIEEALTREIKLRLAAQTRSRRLTHSVKALETQVRALEIVRDTIKRPKVTNHRRARANRNDITHEILFSDLHYGKKCGGYSSAIAAERVDAYADRVVEMQRLDKPRRTTLVIMGDLIENADKHMDARDGCDLSTSEQMAGVLPLLSGFIGRVAPGSGLLLDVVCVSGNHENPRGRGSQFNHQGRLHLSFPIYAGLKHYLTTDSIRFNIVDGVYVTYSPYGSGGEARVAVAEHGHGVSVGEKPLENRRSQRSSQLGRLVNFFRMGDKHTASTFDGGNLIVNGAFFEAHHTEFSGATGYSGHDAQLVVKHSHRGVEDIAMVRL